MKSLRVLAISGSLRKNSFNRKALAIAKQAACSFGQQVVELDLKELNLPVYDGDIEERGLPESVVRLKREIKKSEMLIISSPEYNHSISGALKNAIDWASRGDDNSFDKKTAAIFGVSNGRFGTVRGQRHLREVLEGLNVIILPKPEIFITNGDNAFDKNNQLIDKNSHLLLVSLIKQTISFTLKLKNTPEK